MAFLIGPAEKVVLAACKVESYFLFYLHHSFFDCGICGGGKLLYSLCSCCCYVRLLDTRRSGGSASAGFPKTWVRPPPPCGKRCAGG